MLLQPGRMLDELELFHEVLKLSAWVYQDETRV